MRQNAGVLLADMRLSKQNQSSSFSSVVSSSYSFVFVFIMMLLLFDSSAPGEHQVYRQPALPPLICYDRRRCCCC